MGREPQSPGKRFSSHKGPEAATRAGGLAQSEEAERSEKSDLSVARAAGCASLRAARFLLLMSKRPIGHRFSAEG